MNNFFSFLLPAPPELRPLSPVSRWLSVISIEGKWGNLRPVAGILCVVCDLRLALVGEAGSRFEVVVRGEAVTGGRGRGAGVVGDLAGWAGDRLRY